VKEGASGRARGQEGGEGGEGGTSCVRADALGPLGRGDLSLR
jgi:hypothetical protein